MALSGNNNKFKCSASASASVSASWRMEDRQGIIFFMILKFIKDLLFPVFCLSCGFEEELMCASCLEKLNIKIQLFCPVCYCNNSGGRVCLRCKNKSFLDGVISLADYKNDIISELVKKLKYEYVEEIAGIFGKIFKKSLQTNNFQDLFIGDCVFIPVPLHQRRFLIRGFNQSKLIADEFSRFCNVSVLKDILVRTRFTIAQAQLNGVERRKNLQGAFKIKKPINYRKVILVDDVFTTGSTLQECAKVLKQAGVGEVWALTVAREV